MLEEPHKQQTSPGPSRLAKKEIVIETSVNTVKGGM